MTTLMIIQAITLMITDYIAHQKSLRCRSEFALTSHLKNNTRGTFSKFLNLSMSLLPASVNDGLAGHRGLKTNR